jgi:HAD superfamily hydrolase (TIGR01509 family)
MSAPAAALLDVDGTLVDSNDAHARAWVETLAAAGFDVPYARVRRLIGKGGDKLVPEVTGLTDEARVKELGEARTRLFLAKQIHEVRAFPRVRALLERMRDAGLLLVVATSAKDDELDRLLEIADVADLLDAAATKDDAKRSKPDPDIVGAALARAGIQPSDAIMLGDTPYDVEAARGAGVATVALRSGGWDDRDFADAIAVYADVSALLAEFEESPFALLARAGRRAPTKTTGTRGS